MFEIGYCRRQSNKLLYVEVYFILIELLSGTWFFLRFFFPFPITNYLLWDCIRVQVPPQQIVPNGTTTLLCPL
jgi:hypothetical protein